LLRCSRCRYISYCSKECQQEHWVKVHSQHCKYLARQKELHNNRHDPTICPGCIREAEIGQVRMSRTDNPDLGCPWFREHFPRLPLPAFRNVGLVDAATPLPFDLGEITGQFLSKAEHTASILSHLLHKLKMTKHPAYSSNPAAINHMEKMVINMRQVIWLNYIHRVPDHLETPIAISIKSVVADIVKQSDEINGKLAKDKFKDQSEFRLWDTYKLFLGILLNYKFVEAVQDSVRMGLPGLPEHLAKLLVTPAQFSDMWVRVLNSFTGKAVPYTDLLRKVCGSDLNQKCFGCLQDITVSDVGYGNCKIPFIYQGFIPAYLCGDVGCYKQVHGLNNQVLKTCVKINCELAEHSCDYCFLVSRTTVHRCTRCLTKYYCGVECRDADWAKVHKLVCKKDQGRKVKSGKQERRQKGMDNFLEWELANGVSGC